MDAKYNLDGIMRYANLLVSMEGMSRSNSLKQAWRDARDIVEWVEIHRATEYICSFEMVSIPGVEWVTPDESWERRNVHI